MWGFEVGVTVYGFVGVGFNVWALGSLGFRVWGLDPKDHEVLYNRSSYDFLKRRLV